MLLLQIYRKRKKSDAYCLQFAHSIRRSLTKPRNSGFRVVAVLELSDSTYILGANDEVSSFIGSCICAERAALMEYRKIYGRYTRKPGIRTVYVVSDHPTKPIPPGCLCCEYLYCHEAVNVDQTRIVMQSADETTDPTIQLARDLYPYPSCTSRCRTSAEAQAVSRNITIASIPTEFHELIVAATEKMKRVNTDHIHPVRFAAAVKLSDGRILSYSQRAALEYGCTQDAVSGVLCQAEDALIELLVQIDAHSTPHAPFAPARSRLTESQLKCRILVFSNSQLSVITPDALVPHVADIF